ncbi:MAG: HAMP domain-containing sensor histidine kinase [Spirochaetota bacterium]
MGAFEIDGVTLETGRIIPEGETKLGSSVLLHNALWFIKVRWIIVLILIAAGISGILIPDILVRIGLNPPVIWPWALAGALAIVNIIFYFFAVRLKKEREPRGVEKNIWLQIASDLIFVTILVYIIGSTNTFIPFTYLFHIALACIFFPPKDSLFVTLMAVGLYIISVILELAEILPGTGILRDTQLMHKKDLPLTIIFAGSAVFIWFVVWYFVSNLSKTVRRRDQQLSAMNEQLTASDAEKTKQVLITTHELKSPFAGIESNIHLLKYQYWNEIPESVHEIIDRIETRAQTLRERIRKILILGELKSPLSAEEQLQLCDLQAVMKAVLEEVGEKAQERQITLDIQVPQITVIGSMKQLIILFSNLVGNAIVYSYPGGKVEVSTRTNREEVRVSVSDHGIGIREDALPYIFDEYYSTKEAAKFNKMSTGLGLSMVKEIVKKLKLKIKVTSELEKGTNFEVTLKKKKN